MHQGKRVKSLMRGVHTSFLAVASATLSGLERGHCHLLYGTMPGEHGIRAPADVSPLHPACPPACLPHTDCFAMPLLVHAAVALFSCAMFALVNLLLIMADHELKVWTRTQGTEPKCSAELDRRAAGRWDRGGGMALRKVHAPGRRESW